MELQKAIQDARQRQRENIVKGFEPIEKAEENDIEKGHNVGDVHPNGKWVWKQLPSGKYDWRTINGIGDPKGTLANLQKQNQVAHPGFKTLDYFKGATTKTEPFKRGDVVSFDIANIPHSGIITRVSKDGTLAEIKNAVGDLVTREVDRLKLHSNPEGVKDKMKASKYADGKSYYHDFEEDDKPAKSVAQQSDDDEDYDSGMFKPNGWATKEFLDYLTANVNKIWPNQDFSEYRRVEVKQSGSPEAGYIRVSGVNNKGVNVLITDAYLHGGGTTGSNGVSSNKNIKTVMKGFKTKPAKKVTIVSKQDYNKVKAMDKKQILAGIQYKIHSLTEKDDKYDLTNAYFSSRHGDFEVK